MHEASGPVLLYDLAEREASSGFVDTFCNIEM
jgi:hypothetical protein